jgi:mono/diheme cytochrome c family protein
MTRATTATLAALLASTAPAFSGDLDHGEVLARQWCASCHIVAEDQARGADNVPSFSSIANRPGFDPVKIARFLRDPHAKMPDMQLSSYEADDLAAYIASLRR